MQTRTIWSRATKFGTLTHPGEGRVRDVYYTPNPRGMAPGGRFWVAHHVFLHCLTFKKTGRIIDLWEEKVVWGHLHPLLMPTRAVWYRANRFDELFSVIMGNGRFLYTGWLLCPVRGAPVSSCWNWSTVVIVNDVYFLLFTLFYYYSGLQLVCRCIFRMVSFCRAKPMQRTVCLLRFMR